MLEMFLCWMLYLVKKTVLHNADASSLNLGLPRAYFYDNLDPDMAKVMSDVHAKLRDSCRDHTCKKDIPDIGELNKKVGFPVALYENGQLIP